MRSMPGWTLLDTHSTQGRIFHRPLDTLETSFVWGSFCDGSSDGPLRFDLHLSDAKDVHLFSDANIVKAWLSTKRRYPLLGATIQAPPDGPPTSDAQTDVQVPDFLSKPHFVVRECDLAALRPREIVFENIASAEEIDSRVHAILDGPRSLSKDLLAQLFVFRQTGSTDVLHIMTLTPHCTGDVTSMTSVVRCFLDMLSRGGEPEPTQAPLEDRLGMAVPMMEREPVQLRAQSPIRRRWQKAVANVILQSRMEKLQGGHGLPCRVTPSTSFSAARSRRTSVSITLEETAVVLANCRRHKITFGNAYFVLAQVAMTRVLYRRYLRGEMSEDEWAYRKKQPHIVAGPFNLRRLLDRAWFEKGGGGDSTPSIGTFFYKLPFMSLGDTEGRYQPREQNLGLSDGAPLFSELLTFDRFLHRADLIKKQANGTFQHPLFFELTYGWNATVEMIFRQTTLQWLERIEASKNGEDEDESDSEVLEVMDMPVTLAHGGSSFGSLDSLLPREYPLPSTHPLSPFSPILHPSKAGYVFPSSAPLSPATATTGTNSITPTIVMKDVMLDLHTRPGELYTCAWSTGGRLDMFTFYDNVFEQAVVQEWMDEIKGAVLWYLGRPHESRRSGERHAGNVGAGSRPRLDTQAKL